MMIPVLMGEPAFGNPYMFAPKSRLGAEDPLAEYLPKDLPWATLAVAAGALAVAIAIKGKKYRTKLADRKELTADLEKALRK